MLQSSCCGYSKKIVTILILSSTIEKDFTLWYAYVYYKDGRFIDNFTCTIST